MTDQIAQRYVKRPLTIEAMPLVLERAPALGAWLDSHNANWYSDNAGIHITTLEGTMHASWGDWIIRGVRGEFYPCKPDVFATTYELAA